MLEELPKHHFKAIVADPPWSFRTWSEKGSSKSAERHYSIMTTEDICNLPVEGVAADNCVLFLWVTNPLLPEGLKVLSAWGFKYSTVAFTWAKLSRATQPSWAPKYHIGMGYWTRSNSEICLLGIKGKPSRLRADVRQLIVAPVREHSRKPIEFYESVERLCEGPHLELFARQSREGWTTVGNERTLFDDEKSCVFKGIVPLVQTTDEKWRSESDPSKGLLCAGYPKVLGKLMPGMQRLEREYKDKEQECFLGTTSSLLSSVRSKLRSMSIPKIDSTEIIELFKY